MTLRQLPEINALDRLDGLQFEPDTAALERWNADIQAAHEGSDNVISIYEVIGEDYWTGGGITARRIAGALRAIGDKDITVNINSPGGDFFEGIAIYSLLREHPHKVTVKVLGLAASAASVIAMAGDEIQISEVGFLMIHNAWGMAIGNRHELRASADVLEPFDQSMANLYAARSGEDKETAVSWMDDETWFGAEGAIEAGLADGVLPSTDLEEIEDSGAKSLAAVRRVDSSLARQGIPRSERRSLIGEIKHGMPGAAMSSKQDAGDLVTGINRLIKSMKS